MEWLKLLWGRDYCSDLVLSGCLILVFIISILKRKQHPQFRFLPYYFFSFILLQIIFYSYYLIPEGSHLIRKNLFIRRYLDILVTIIEFLSFMYFFHSILKELRRKLLTKRISQVVLVVAIFIIVKFIIPAGYDNYQATTVIYLFASLALLPPCYFYYQELITHEQGMELLESANFWAASGIAFYSLCTLPTTLVLNYFYSTDFKVYQSIFSIINVFYVVLILMVCKSYFCKNTKLV